MSSSPLSLPTLYTHTHIPKQKQICLAIPAQRISSAQHQRHPTQPQRTQPYTCMTIKRTTPPPFHTPTHHPLHPRHPAGRHQHHRREHRNDRVDPHGQGRKRRRRVHHLEADVIILVGRVEAIRVVHLGDIWVAVLGEGDVCALGEEESQLPIHIHTSTLGRLTKKYSHYTTTPHAAPIR